ncbi:MAG TPA: hypothetical protein VG895_05780 [Patescibacteria group bacterium]|nr:hypothetical protein [Gammaproteobacteria bacterium]HWA52524.1 hypothetical protein [Patescibacteria group bacterium]
MKLFCDMANAESDAVLDTLLDALRNKEKIVFLPQQSSLPPFKEWLVFDTTKFIDREIYYCIVNGWQNENRPVQLLSYSAFLQGAKVF